MAKVEAIDHRTKETNTYPLGGGVFLIEQELPTREV